MTDSLLPIGSVVSLNKGNKKLMVIGLKQMESTNPEKIYDYQIDNSYYKSYGKISRDTIKLTLSDDKLRELRLYLGLLSDRQFKALNEFVVNARNLGIDLSYQDLLFLTKELLGSASKIKSNSIGSQTKVETEEEKKQRE